MAIEDIQFVVPMEFSFKPWYLLLDYRIWALLILVICILIRVKKPKRKKIATLIIVQDFIVTFWMMFNGTFKYIWHSSIDGHPYYSLGDAILGCLVLSIGIFILSLLYLIIEKIVNYKKSDK